MAEKSKKPASTNTAMTAVHISGIMAAPYLKK
jgi:hypothetical protein